MILTKELKKQLELEIRKSLKALGMLRAFKAHLRQTDSNSLIITVVPKSRSKFVTGMCESLTVKGRQCRLEPAPGERLCPLHLTLSKEEE